MKSKQKQSGFKWKPWCGSQTLNDFQAPLAVLLRTAMTPVSAQLHRRDSLCRQSLFCETTAPCLSGRSLLGIYISTRVHQRMGPPRTQWARGSWDHCWVWEGRRLIAEPLEGWSPLENCVLRKVIQGPAYSKTAVLHLCILCFWVFI